MTAAELEDTYTALADQIDALGPEKSELFLAKLALLLAHKIGDAGEVGRCIKDAADGI